MPAMSTAPIWGPIAGGVASTAVGSLLGGGDSSANDTQEAFQDFSTSGGLFDSALRNTGKGQDSVVDYGINGPIGNLQSQLIGGAQNMFGNQGNAGMAGEIGAQFLGGLGSSNPLETQQALFGQLSPQLIAQQNQDFFDMEGRLFGQGRLGSTGGNNQLGTLFDSQADARNRLLGDTFGMAQQAQAQQAGIGAQMSQLDPQLQGLFSGIGNQQLMAALGIQDSADRSFRTGAQVGGASRISEQNAGQDLGLGGAIGRGLMMGGLDKIGQGVEGFDFGNMFGGSPPNMSAQPYTDSYGYGVG